MNRILSGGLVEAWQPKLVTAGLGAGAIQVLQHVGALYGRLFDTDPLLVLLCCTLLFVDVVTGVAAALRRGERVSSRAFRRTGWKVIEYTAIAAALVMVANGFAATWAHYLTDGLDDAALLYIALTEAMSVVENVTGSRAAAMRIVRKIIRVRDDGPGGLLTVEEVVTKMPLHPPAPAAAPADAPPTDPEPAAAP